LVGTIEWRRIRQAERLIQTQLPDNESTTWNCQEWVVETLAALRQAGLLQMGAGMMRQIRSQHQNWQ